MTILNTPLFATRFQTTIGVGYHNIGIFGILRASKDDLIKQLEEQYGERCGHLPLYADRVHVYVHEQRTDVQEQMHYLSQLTGKEIKAVTATELRAEQELEAIDDTLIVPYVNVPEVETWARQTLRATSWGLPGRMVSLLKNKADFYQLLEECLPPDFAIPDYCVTTIADLPARALAFLQTIEALKMSANLSQYPAGMMFRAAESDGNFGSCIVYEQRGLVNVVPDGDVLHVTGYQTWEEALAVVCATLDATMNQQKEDRVVISRLIDLLDSPGLSAVIIDGQFESLRWNGQLQQPGSKACVGTSTYVPKDDTLARIQQEYEDCTAQALALLLHKTAEHCGIDFSTCRGLANIDIIIPGPLEVALQRSRGMQPLPYIAECNPRWTNYTDAIMTALGVNREAQTVGNMKTVIEKGIMTIDKYYLPQHVDPRVVRDSIWQRDDVLKREGTRVICRMTKNPMGFIFTGDTQRAQQEVAAVIRQLAFK
jgi:hypothetical protein